MRWRMPRTLAGEGSANGRVRLPSMGSRGAFSSRPATGTELATIRRGGLSNSHRSPCARSSLRCGAALESGGARPAASAGPAAAGWIPIEKAQVFPGLASWYDYPKGGVRGVQIPLGKSSSFLPRITISKSSTFRTLEQVGLALGLAIAPPSTDSIRRWYEPTPVSRREGLGPRTPGCGPGGRNRVVPGAPGSIAPSNS